MKLYIDIETFSSIDLKASGVYRYVESPDFDIMMASWAVDNSPVEVALGERDINKIPWLWDHEVTKFAHNANFERVCFSTLRGLPVGQYLPPDNWWDTQSLAGEWGYPQKLEDLARALGGEQKDTAGLALIKLFCMPDKFGRRVRSEDHPEKWAAFVEYCRQDTETLRDVARTLGAWPTEFERTVYNADQRVNDRGIAIDRELARAAVLAAEDNRMVQELEITQLTGVRNPNSVQQMRRWLDAEGLGELLPNLQAETVEAALLSPDLTTTQRRILELRTELALVAARKFGSALAGVNDDGMLRGNFRFFGAHTGRWSSKGVQLHNLPRAGFIDAYKKRDDMTDTVKEAAALVDTALAITDLKTGLGCTAHELKASVRPLFTGPFTVLDYSAIEARVIAWLAGEQWVLDAFEAGRDIYVEMAKRMTDAVLSGKDFDRGDGKIATLALGFQGAVTSLRNMGATGTDEELRTIVQVYRMANPHVVQLWATLGERIGEPGRIGKHLRISRSGGRMHLHLPSGRAIVYHGVKHETYRIRDKDGNAITKEGWRYRDPSGRGRIGTYGGRLAENATQATARDILAEALVRLEEAGYEVVAHIHDEVAIRGEHDVAEVAALMSVQPSWAKGLPIATAGFVTDRYRKG